MRFRVLMKILGLVVLSCSGCIADIQEEPITSRIHTSLDYRVLADCIVHEVEKSEWWSGPPFVHSHYSKPRYIQINLDATPTDTLMPVPTLVGARIMVYEESVGSSFTVQAVEPETGEPMRQIQHCLPGHVSPPPAVEGKTLEKEPPPKSAP